MKKFRDFLNEELKDKELAKDYYKELEKTRIAIEITNFREKKGITQKELAKMINTTQSVIARLENPEYKKYSLSTLKKVADALNLELIVSFKEKNVEKLKNIDSKENAGLLNIAKERKKENKSKATVSHEKIWR